MLLMIRIDNVGSSQEGTDVGDEQPRQCSRRVKMLDRVSVLVLAKELRQNSDH